MFSLLVCCVRDVSFVLVKMNKFFTRISKEDNVFVVGMDVYISDLASVLQQCEKC